MCPSQIPHLIKMLCFIHGIYTSLSEQMQQTYFIFHVWPWTPYSVILHATLFLKSGICLSLANVHTSSLWYMFIFKIYRSNWCLIIILGTWPWFHYHLFLDSVTFWNNIFVSAVRSSSVRINVVLMEWSWLHSAFSFIRSNTLVVN